MYWRWTRLVELHDFDLISTRKVFFIIIIIIKKQLSNCSILGIIIIQLFISVFTLFRPESGYWSYDELSPPVSCSLAFPCPGALDTISQSVTVLSVTSTNTNRAPSILSDGSTNTRQCAVGYSGVLCNTCADGYYSDGQSGVCLSCGSSNNLNSQLRGLEAAVVILFGSLTLIIIFGSARIVGTSFDLVRNFQQLIVVGMIGCSSFPNDSSIQKLATFFNFVSVINFNVNAFKPGCSVSNLSFLDIFFTVCLVVLCVSVLFLIASIARASVAFPIESSILKLLNRVLWNKKTTKKSNTAANHDQNLNQNQNQNHDNTDIDTDIDSTAVAVTKHNKIWTFREAMGFKKNSFITENSSKPLFELEYELNNISFREAFSRRAILSQIVLGFFVYLRLSTYCIKCLQCIAIPESSSVNSSTGEVSTYGGSAKSSNKISVLQADGITQCYSGVHQYSMILVFCLLILFSVGFPLLCCYLLYRRFHRDRKQLENFHFKDIIQLEQSYGYLYNGLRKQTYLYRILQLVFTFIFVMITILPSQINIQLFLSGLLTCTRLLIAAYYMPFVQMTQNYIEILIPSITLLQSILYLGVSSIGDSDYSGKSFVFFLVLLILSVFSLGGLLYVKKHKHKKLKVRDLNVKEIEVEPNEN